MLAASPGRRGWRQFRIPRGRNSKPQAGATPGLVVVNVVADPSPRAPGESTMAAKFEPRKALRRSRRTHPAPRSRTTAKSRAEHKEGRRMPRSAKLPPVRLVRVVERLRHRLNRLHQHLVPPPAAMIELILGAFIPQ